MDFNATKTLTTAGAVGGILYGIKKQSGFWATAGYTLLFALVGTALGTAVGSAQNK
jgi:ABC-type nitrate/sulfonate/bicarbonate transport system permease component